MSSDRYLLMLNFGAQVSSGSARGYPSEGRTMRRQCRGVYAYPLHQQCLPSSFTCHFLPIHRTTASLTSEMSNSNGQPDRPILMPAMPATRLDSQFTSFRVPHVPFSDLIFDASVPTARKPCGCVDYDVFWVLAFAS